MNVKALGLALIATLSWTLSWALSWGSTVQAADVKVLASNPVRTMLGDVAPLFERASEHKVTLGFGTSAQVAKRVIAGEAELAIWQISAMKPVQGLDVVGPLPAELQLITHLSTVVGAGTTAPDAAKALIVFLHRPKRPPRCGPGAWSPAAARAYGSLGACFRCGVRKIMLN